MNTRSMTVVAKADKQRKKDEVKRREREVVLRSALCTSCTICGQDMRDVNGMCVLKCSHVVHSLCILDRLDRYNRTTCTTCRNSVLKEEDE